jgi:hypothetical protein
MSAGGGNLRLQHEGRSVACSEYVIEIHIAGKEVNRLLIIKGSKFLVKQGYSID